MVYLIALLCLVVVVVVEWFGWFGCLALWMGLFVGCSVDVYCRFRGVAAGC